jgi:hypothetical protein
MLRTTLGSLLVNQALPPDLRNYGRRLDKKGVEQLFAELAEKHPDEYGEISRKLMRVAADAAYQTGGLSFGLEHLRTADAALAARRRIKSQLQKILSGNGSADSKREAIIQVVEGEQATMGKAVYEEALQKGNPLAKQVASGARGNPAQLNRLIASDMLYVNHRDQPIPIPVLKSYSEGLSPAEYAAGAYGARKGVVQTKTATADAGYLNKQLAQVAHKLLVTAIDDEDDGPDSDRQTHTFVRGLPVEVDDPDNAGALLAATVGGFPRNTVLTPRILQQLQAAGIKRMLVRSPLVGGPAGGGVYARDVGVRERGGLPPLGDLVGIAASQALGERLTQMSLSSKHAGGVRGVAPATSGFKFVNQLLQVPKYFPGGATHAQLDGVVERVEPAPAGGQFVTIGGQPHYVSPELELKIQRGQEVEAGDVLTTGIPNPAEIYQHKSVGEGRRYFTKAFHQAYRDSGVTADRRNVELAARGLLNYVEMLDETDDYLPGDMLEYNRLEAAWRPREGYRTVPTKQALGKYLERPVLHHTIGTKVRKSMLPELQEFGVQELDVHDDPPPFRPVMIRAAAVVGEDPDPFVRFLGSHQKKNLLESVHRGRISDTQNVSFAPALAAGEGFGSDWPKSVLKQPGR